MLIVVPQFYADTIAFVAFVTDTGLHEMKK